MLPFVMPQDISSAKLTIFPARAGWHFLTNVSVLQRALLRNSARSRQSKLSRPEYDIVAKRRWQMISRHFVKAKIWHFRSLPITLVELDFNEKHVLQCANFGEEKQFV